MHAYTNRDWWPNQLDISILHQHSNLSNPYGWGLWLRQGIQQPRPGRRLQASARPDDRLL